MTPDAELESLAEKATPGPWTWDGYRMSAQPNLKKRVYNPTVISVEDGVTYSEYTQGSAELVISEDDAAYIAAANPQRILTLLREKRALVEALREISKGAGAFNRDPLIHASNCIDEMKATARAALAQAGDGEGS